MKHENHLEVSADKEKQAEQEMDKALTRSRKTW
jgi:hypothetical protein